MDSRIADSGQNHRKTRRSQHVCETCRARKVKCDQRPNGCSNCERLGLRCAASNVSPQEEMGLVATAGKSRPRRGRIYRSCVECRKSKTRCNGIRPACLRCQQRKTQCVYASSALPRWTRRVRAPEMSAPGARPSSPEEPGSLPDADVPSGFSWLTRRALPCRERIRLLVDQYFMNIHPLRCYAFIHKPCFMQRLECGDMRTEGNALIQIICALGAQFYALEQHDAGKPLTTKFIRNAGREWAMTAQRLILTDLDQISVESLMASLLVQEYAIRMGNFALAFMLSSMTARMSQALQINLEYSTDILCKETDRGPSGTLRESRRRLMWCCYVTDSLVGSGVDQLTLIDEEDLKIQLPCNERSFIQQTIRITETLRDRQTLPFIPSDIRSSDYGDNMGIVACFLRLVEVRRRVLRYIKHLDKAKVPWLSDSEFAVLDSECKAWHDSLPPSLQFTPSALFIRQETGQVGALCILHCAYHQTMCDLYRLGAPKLYKLRGAFSFPPEERAFVTHLQWTLFEHAKALARIVEETGRYGTKALADSWLPTITYDSCRIIVYHLTQIIDPSAETSTGLTEQAIPFLEGSLQMLKRMQALYAVAEPLVFIVQLLFLDIIALRSLTRLQYVAAKTMVGKFGLGSEAIRRMKSIIPDDPYRPNPEEAAEGPSAPGTPPQSTPEYVLNPLSLYRMARKAIPEKHAPEDINVNVNVHSQHSGTSTQSPPGASIDELQPDGVVPVDDQVAFEELQSLFTFNLGWAWQPQPVETAVGSGLDGGGGGPFPYALGFQTGDPQTIGEFESWTSNSV